MIDASEVEHLFSDMRNLYGRAPAGRDAACAWALALGNVDRDDVRRAWFAWSRESDRAPTPAGLLRLIRDLPRRAGPERVHPPCAPCERDGGLVLEPTSVTVPARSSCVGPDDRGGPPEPMCGIHYTRYTDGSHAAAGGA